jgi:hypothetical protein
MGILTRAMTRFLAAQDIDADLLNERLVTRREAAELTA